MEEKESSRVVSGGTWVGSEGGAGDGCSLDEAPSSSSLSVVSAFSASAPIESMKNK